MQLSFFAYWQTAILTIGGRPDYSTLNLVRVMPHKKDHNVSGSAQLTNRKEIHQSPFMIRI
jgi:hypothetical protein